MSEALDGKTIISSSEAGRRGDLSSAQIIRFLTQGRLIGRRNGHHWEVEVDSVNSYLTIVQKQRGPSHPFVVSLQRELSQLHQAQGRYAEAGTVLRQALEGEPELEATPLVAAALLPDLAMVCLLEGKYEEGAGYSQQAHALRAPLLGLDPADPWRIFVTWRNRAASGRKHPPVNGAPLIEARRAL